MTHVFSLVFNKILKLLTYMTFYSVSAVIGYAAGYKRLNVQIGLPRSYTMEDSHMKGYLSLNKY